MKVLVADKFEKSGLDGLKSAGCDVVYQPDLKDDGLTAAIRESAADVLVVRSTTVTAPMLEAGGLALVPRARARLNTNVRAPAAKQRLLHFDFPGKHPLVAPPHPF